MTNPTPAADPAGRPQAGGDADPRASVLVVEENASASGAVSDLVRRLGYRVTAASVMLDALAALRRTQFSVVLLAFEMPSLEAVDALKQLRGQAADGRGFATAANATVIALTRSGQALGEERRRELDFDDELARPLRASQVREMLTKHLAQRPESRASTALNAPMNALLDAPVDAELRLLDPAALARLAELDPKGDNRLIERVLQAFKTSAARLRPQVEAARRAGDLKTLRLVAHTFKSSSASIGATRLTELCAGVEASIRIESVDDLDSQLDAMDAALGGVLAAISRLLKEPS